MELLFILIIIASFIIVMNYLRSRFKEINDNLNALNKKISLLKPIEESIPNPVVVPKIENIKPIIPDAIVPEITKPILESPIPPAIAEKVVLATEKNSLSNPITLETQSKPSIKSIPKKSFWENFKEKNPDLEKFIGENLISKIGILILVLGISYFVKYSIDRGWINEPARVGIGILCGVLVMAVAHKLRRKYIAFSSVFVAGAITIFYFTIGLAFQEYHLFNQTVAFCIMVVITAFSCLTSLSYNRIELAVLSLIGGFSVPFIVSTGDGNYVVLFSYIIILNIGILAIAYHKKWGLVNIIAYLFTLILYGSWLAIELNDKPKPHYIGAFVFGFLFYLMFVLMSIIHNLRAKGEFTKTQLLIMTSNSFFFFGVGMSILENFHPEYKGLFTTFLALLNLIYAWFLHKKFGLDKNAIYLFIGLTLTFVTLSIPLQFQGNYITLFWAVEAVLLMWLAQKSKIKSYKLGSIIVHFLMIISLAMDWGKYYFQNETLSIVLNPIFITGFVATVSLFLISFLLKNEDEESKQFGISFDSKKYIKLTTGIGIVIAYIVGFLEVLYQSDSYINNSGTRLSFVSLYHLLFFLILFYILKQNKTAFNTKFNAIIAAVNIFLYTFWFSFFTFKEHQEIMSYENGQPIALYLHYIALAIIIYFGYQLYKMNKEKLILDILNKTAYTWIVAFFIVNIASSEVMLHGLLSLNSSITNQQVLNYNPEASNKNEIITIREILSFNMISDSKVIIIKTAYPILWGILAFVFLIFGIKKQNKTLRIVDLSLLGLTVVKLFLYDISTISETGKIIAFILLGILILIISFVYQKTKIRVIDEPVTNKTETNENF